MAATLRLHTAAVAEAAGLRFEYHRAAYHPSGAGAFGRYGGGRRGRPL